MYTILFFFVHSDNAYIEVLDSTRIHPETYEWARKMAVDALEYDEASVLLLWLLIVPTRLTCTPHFTPLNCGITLYFTFRTPHRLVMILTLVVP